MTEPVSTSATIGDKVISTAVAGGGLTLPLWIQYFKEYAQIAITLCYLIVAIAAVIKTFKGKRNDRQRNKKHK